ncbi:MAG: methyltransferase [Treponema sp.]|nr:MAG: methyltransferase [Treponema sp.]
MEEVKAIIKKAGFKQLHTIVDEVTDAYALKWGYGLKIKDYIQRTFFIGKKQPL